MNSVKIGVPPTSKPINYLIAISSPLKGKNNKDTPVNEDKPNSCVQGSIILVRNKDDGTRPAAGHEAPTKDQDGNEVPGKPKSYPTSEEHIVASPYRDDQYAIKITNTL